MATLATSLPVFVCLLFLFTFSSARNIHDLFSRSESEPENTHSDSKHLQSDTVSLTIKSTRAISDPVPLKFISFRPINRHLPIRLLPLSYRLGHHRCRHGHRLQDPRIRDIPYGSDAIMRSGFDPANRGGVRQIPSLWTRYPDGEQRLSEVRAYDHQSHHDRHHQHHREGGHVVEGFLKRIRTFFNMF